VAQTLGGWRSVVDVEPHILEDPVEDVRTILVCSDGLTNLRRRRAIAAAHRRCRTLITDALLQLALDAGAPDNVTVGVLRVSRWEARTAKA